MPVAATTALVLLLLLLTHEKERHSADATRRELYTAASALATLGALLFYCGDSSGRCREQGCASPDRLVNGGKGEGGDRGMQGGG